MKLVEVSWIDSYVDGGWSEYKPERKHTYTYGLLVNRDEEWVTLAMTKEEGYWGNLWYIPSISVENVRVIEDHVSGPRKSGEN
jgi:hypothetical protein